MAKADTSRDHASRVIPSICFILRPETVSSIPFAFLTMLMN